MVLVSVGDADPPNDSIPATSELIDKNTANLEYIADELPMIQHGK